MVAFARITIELPADTANTLLCLLALCEAHAQRLLDNYQTPQQHIGATEIKQACAVAVKAIQAGLERGIRSDSPREGEVDQGLDHANGSAGVATGAATDAPPAVGLGDGRAS